MLDKEEIRDMIQEHVDAENAADIDRVLATYSDHAPIFEDVATGVRCVGGEQIIGEYRNVWDGFPGLSRLITRWTIGENSAVIEVTISGKHEGPFQGLPPTGHDVLLQGVGHFEFDEDGRIQHETVYYDSLTLVRQITGRRGTT